MELITVDEGGAGKQAGSRRFRTTEAAKALMSIETSEVVRRFVEKEVRMVGKVDFDETNLAYITAWVPGRIDRLYVDYTGIDVRKGDHMVYLYSPDLLTAQDELRRAADAVKNVSPNAPDVLKQTAESMLRAAREKLRRWGLTDAQIEAAESGGPASDHVTIYAPIGGTVIHREGQEGMYVDTGSRIYTIADLKHVWVKLDAYESDIPWIHYGQSVRFTTESYPGEEFEGKISFIDPVLDMKTRTVKVRVNVPNPDGRLKPEMFVRAVVKSQLATDSRVMDPSISGKWICPMHPEVIKDDKGGCDACGMPLVKAEELGYVSAEASDEDKPLVVPASAPLITGTRAVVYVEVPNQEAPTFEGREVVLGPRAGDFYIVRSGLREGEYVVTNGNFKIDSALQISAKPSMMAPDDVMDAGEEHAGHEHAAKDEGARHAAEAASTFPVPEDFQAQLGGVYEAYLRVQDALASDDLQRGRDAAAQMLDALESVDMELLKGEAHMDWMRLAGELRKALEQSGNASSLDVMREAFSPLSNALWVAAERFGVQSERIVYQAHCPMALGGKGADWLQGDKAIRNPYFGASMLSCGSIQGKLEPQEEASPERPSDEPATSRDQGAAS